MKFIEMFLDHELLVEYNCKKRELAYDIDIQHVWLVKGEKRLDLKDHLGQEELNYIEQNIFKLESSEG